MKTNLLSGAEIRFMRKEIGMNSKAFAESIGVTPVTLSRWENEEKRQTESHDKLIRYAFKCMMQQKICSILDNLESMVKKSQVISIVKNRINVDTSHLKYVDIPHIDSQADAG